MPPPHNEAVSMPLGRGYSCLHPFVSCCQPTWLCHWDRAGSGAAWRHLRGASRTMQKGQRDEDWRLDEAAHYENHRHLELPEAIRLFLWAEYQWQYQGNLRCISEIAILISCGARVSSLKKMGCFRLKEERRWIMPASPAWCDQPVE